MDIGHIPLMAALQSQMFYTGARHAVIARNIANADTPGYVPQDVKAPSFADRVAGQGGGHTVAMWRTNPMHMDGVMAQSAYQTYKRQPTAETKPNGNQVSIEEEVEKMSMNQSDYEDAVKLYKANITMFNTALGHSGP